MATHLVIIEAPGKRQSMANMLWRSGMRDVEVMATVGHIGTNPDGFKPLGVDAAYRELAYRLKPEKERLAADIGREAKLAQKIYVATDDDDEGDVIARDVMRFCIDDEDHAKVLRLRLKALSAAEIQAALAQAQPMNELSAARGDSRRVIDRLIGSMSDENGAIGRVQGSMLLMLQSQVPVIGTTTYTMPSDDDKGCWVATVPVFAGQVPSSECELENVASQGRVVQGVLRQRVMNHDDILLSASLELNCSISQVSEAMQTLYEKGRMTYPRAKDHAITAESFKRLQAVARMNGVGFDGSHFGAIRAAGMETGHESPNAMVLDLPLNRSLDLLSIEDQVLVHITRSLVECGVTCQLETPRLMDLGNLPNDINRLSWHRVVATGERLWDVSKTEAGFKPWTAEQSLVHFMMKNELGRPSTIVQHITKFLSRDLVDDNFEFTNKGKEWCYNIAEIFGNKNVSRMIEAYIESNLKPSHEMVAEMIVLCGLEKVSSAVQKEEESINEYDEEYEV